MASVLLSSAEGSGTAIRRPSEILHDNRNISITTRITDY